MLAESSFRQIYIACGYTDLRQGIDGLAALIRTRFNLEPMQKGTLFLFCGRRTDRIKGLVFEGDGFLLLYKRLEDGRFQWPSCPEAVKDLTQEEFERLLNGLAIVETSTINKNVPTRYII